MRGYCYPKSPDSSFYVKQSGDARKQEIRITEDGDTLKIIGKEKRCFI